MKKHECPAGCGKQFISQSHAEKHADQYHKGWNDPACEKRKGWVTPFGFVDFAHPVTYSEACETLESVYKNLAFSDVFGQNTMRGSS